jgi:hypothetical protein
MGEFTGTDVVQLVAGSLYGLRAFLLNHDGTLTSPIRYDFHWKNGEVEAECNSLPFLGHKIGSQVCFCGFYSYHTVEHAQAYYYGPDASIMGVIEGYGHVTIGSKGMRTSKARIVGLVVPRTFWRGKVKDERHELVLKNYPDAATFQNLNAMASAFKINGRPKILA